MATLLERRLAEFVDREAEMRLFCDMVESGEKNVLLVWGDSGLGKSSLLAKMIHECGQRRLRKAEVTWTDTRPHDYLAVMRKLRDDVLSAQLEEDEAAGALKPFTLFSDLVNYFTVPQYELKIKVEGGAAINVANHSSIAASTTGDIGGIIIKDVMLNAARSDMSVPVAERMARLTDRFFADFRQAVGGSRLVVFFDSVEKMSPDTASWLWDELLAGIRDGRVGNVLAVVCGDSRPALDREWEMSIEEARLAPIELPHIVDYLAKRGVEDAMRQALALMLLANTRGYMAEIAKMVDAFLREQKKYRGA